MKKLYPLQKLGDAIQMDQKIVNYLIFWHASRLKKWSFVYIFPRPNFDRSFYFTFLEKEDSCTT